MLLKPNPVPSRHFTRLAGVLVAEASDLGREPFGRVYDDACDAGLTIVSERTGREVVFYVEREVRDAERELLYHVLLPTPESVRRVGCSPSLTVHVFND